VRPRHARAFVLELKGKCGIGPKDMAPRTARHISGLCHTMFADAVHDELIELNPWQLR
jgi:hypothetical protein